MRVSEQVDFLVLTSILLCAESLGKHTPRKFQQKKTVGQDQIYEEEKNGEISVNPGKVTFCHKYVIKSQVGNWT